MITQGAEGASIFLNDRGAAYEAGEVLRQPELARTIEMFAESNGRTFYDGEIGAAIAEWSKHTGGRIGIDDLRHASVIERAPLSVDLGEAFVVATPAPSMGGRIALEILGDIRGSEFLSDSHRFPGIDARVGFHTCKAVERLEPPDTLPPRSGESVAVHDLRDEPFSHSPNTTHVSAIDASGMMASITSSVGFGSGQFIPGTGVQLNNMLAEYGYDQVRAAGAPSPSMMTPMVLLGKSTSGSIGSAGANRIPQALSQITNRLLDGESLEEAIMAPRFIWDGSVLHAEPGHDAGSIQWLADRLEVNEWPAIDAYFGTSNGAATRNGGLFANGDPRRSGLGIVVD
jgi:gamma-glutamyltranspeptidase/glutathione hydrolase